MKILFLTLLDFNSINEKGIYTDLLRKFSKENHELYIISPTEKSKSNKTHIIENGNTTILKLQIGNIQKTNLIEKGMSTLTLEKKFTDGIKKYFSNVKFDLILYSTPPITLQRAVEFVKKRDDAKTYLLLKDIFPQNSIDLQMLKKTGITGLIYKYFRRKEKKLYQVSDYIGCMSKANKEYILRENLFISPSKVEVCPNSIEPVDIQTSTKEKRKIRQKYNIPVDKKIFIYGGNLGKPQDIDYLIECIKLNEQNKDIIILVVGSGTELYKLNNFFDKKAPKNALLLSQIPKDDYELLVQSCDVGLIFLDRRFTIPNFPSRILSYMQASMPVIASTDVNTDVGEVIESGEFGYWCESGKPHEFNELINKLSGSEEIDRLGINARKYLEENYTTKHSYEIIMKHMV